MTSDRISRLPQPLVDDLVLGHVVPVIGAGFSRNAELPSGSMPDWSELAKSLASELPVGLRDGNDPVDILSTYEQEHGRAHLSRRLYDLLHIAEAHAGRAHRALAEMPFDRMVTTNFDLLIEEALRELRTDFFPVVDESQLTLAGARRERVLIKAHGDVHHPDRLVLTEDDFDGWILRNPLMATELASLFIRGTGLLIGYSLSDPDFRQILRLLRDRLGRMTRQPYVLLVNPSPAARARFERRGVRVVDLKLRRGETTGDAYAELFEAMAAIMRNSGVREVKQRQPELGEYLVAEARQSPIVYFAVPRERLRLYRDFLFAHVASLGLVPYSADKIPGGVPVLSAVEGMIERAALVVAEPTSTLSRSELAAATRSGVQVLVVSPSDKDWSRELEEGSERTLVPAPASEQEWSSLANWFGTWLAETTRGMRRDLAAEPRRLLAAGQNRAAVLTGFAYLESALRRALAEAAVAPDPRLGVRQLLQLGLEHNVIADHEMENLLQAAQVRNELAHTDHDLPKRETTQAVDSITTVLRRLGD